MTTGDAPPAGPIRRLCKELADAKGALAVAALVLYGVQRVAYERFYAPFGLSPDDLGLGYVELLARAAVGPALLMALLGLIVWLTVALYVAMISELLEDLRPRLRAVRRPSRAAPPSLALAAIGLLALAGAVIGAPLVLYAVLAAFAVQAGLLALQGTRRARRAIAGDGGAQEPRPANWWARATIAAIVAVAAGSGWLVVAAADEAARDVRAGRATHSTALGVRLASWGAEAATLTWTSDDVDRRLRPLAATCLMYLGRSDGALYVYAPHALGRATFRLDAGAAVLQIAPGRHCRRDASRPVP